MSEKITVNDPNSPFELTIPDDLKDMYVDGVSNLILGFPISKLIFHSARATAPGESQVEQRRATLQLTMQTTTLLELCRNILASTTDNKDQLAVATKIFEARLEQIIDVPAISVTPPPTKNR